MPTILGVVSSEDEIKIKIRIKFFTQNKMILTYDWLNFNYCKLEK